MAHFVVVSPLLNVNQQVAILSALLSAEGADYFDHTFPSFAGTLNRGSPVGDQAESSFSP